METRTRPKTTETITMNIRLRYNYDAQALSIETGLAIEDNEQNNRTKQEFAEEVDINTLLRRFAITGQMPENVRMPLYADFTEVEDFHSAVNAIAQANEAFERMPAEVRFRFNNDPAQFIAFCENEENRAEAEKLGLVDPRPKPPVTPPERLPQTPGEASTGTVPPAPPPQGDTP